MCVKKKLCLSLLLQWNIAISHGMSASIGFNSQVIWITVMGLDHYTDLIFMNDFGCVCIDFIEKQLDVFG